LAGDLRFKKYLHTETTAGVEGFSLACGRRPLDSTGALCALDDLLIMPIKENQ
jgi:hypothetical protein